MADTAAEFLQAIDRNDIDLLREMIGHNPSLLAVQFKWNNDGNSGFALNYAAFRNKPDVIEFLVTEMGADVNRYKDVSAQYTPLTHARQTSAYDAAAMLLELGANPALGDNTVAFANTEGVRAARDPRYRERKAQRAQQEMEKKIAGTWTRTGGLEITHDYERPSSRQRLSDVFNFETRIWRATVKDLDGKGIAQNIVFFDDMPDTAILREPMKKLQELGADIGEDAITGLRLSKKALKPGLSGGK